jgi:hypothetical protein
MSGDGDEQQEGMEHEEGTARDMPIVLEDSEEVLSDSDEEW